jgi:hypothetical protein
MKKSGLFFVILSFLVFSIVSISYGWQGRMGGMGDPFGLVQDESDFLIHPAKIANGKGVQFYGHYLFNYTDVKKWDYNLNDSLTGAFRNDVSGDELRHDGLFGASFPLGSGRMGFFFTYEGMRGDYDGLYNSGINYIIDMKNVLDDFAFKLLYGLPIGGFRLGGEVQIAYRQIGRASCRERV